MPLLDLHCCSQAFSSCIRWGLLSSRAACASHCDDFSCCRARALEQVGFNCCGPQAEWTCHKWNYLGAGIKPMSLAPTSGFPTTGPPRKSSVYFCCCCSVTQLCLTLCDPMVCSTPGFPVLHHLPNLLKLMSIESVMPSSHLILCHPLLLLSSDLSQHQGLF